MEISRCVGIVWDGLGIKDPMVILRIRVCRAFHSRYDVTIVGIFYSPSLLVTTSNRDTCPNSDPYDLFPTLNVV